jgi:hypothetical protein
MEVKLPAANLKEEVNRIIGAEARPLYIIPLGSPA